MSTPTPNARPEPETTAKPATTPGLRRLTALYARPAVGLRRHTAPRIAVVGAGLAGLTAARLLHRNGCDVQVFEASSRAGGRVLSERGKHVPGGVCERGGEFIDTHHTDMLALAACFGLELIDTHAPSEASLAPSYFIEGKHRSTDDVNTAFAEWAPRLALDAASLGASVSAYRHNEVALELDRLSIAEYLDRLGVQGWLRRLIDVAYTTEYGLDPGEQSCLNLLTLIGTDAAAGFEVFGPSDQRYKLVDGNDRITSKLAADLEPRVHLQHRLVRLDQRGGLPQVTFDTPSGSRAFTPDAVVMALPFTTLRHVELRSWITRAKRRVINELGYGTNVKLMMGTQRRLWREQGLDGDLYTDLGCQTGWDSSRARSGSQGMYTLYFGGSQALGLARSSADRFAADVDRVFAGFDRARTSAVMVADWPNEPYALGSYTCRRPGQWTELGGLEGRRCGPVHFAGEHCGGSDQGFMNGAVASGRRVAGAILRAAGLG